MPRPLKEQTVVVTGASSGIGRQTAILLGQRGAKVVLAARDEATLKEVAAEVERSGGTALIVPTDVADWGQVQNLARAAVERFGRMDTWVNDAGVGVGGLVENTTVEEIDHLMRVNVMGQVHGVKAALPYMLKEKAGAFINVGSVAGVRAFPLQTMYSASKHAVKGFSEGLRLELQRHSGDFHVTYIAPAAINTPFFADARTKFGTELDPPPPVYEPEVVAESIVFAAEHPRRDIFVGGGGKMFDILQRISPPLMDRMMMMGDNLVTMQISGRPRMPTDNLFTPPDDARAVHGKHANMAHKSSLYTRVFEWHPALKPLALGVVAVGAVALIKGLSRPRPVLDGLAKSKLAKSLTPSGWGHS